MKKKETILSQKLTQSIQSLYEACQSGNLKNVLNILKNQKTLINRPNENGDFPLHIACLQGNLDVIEVLLQNGADVAKIDNRGYLPIHYSLLKSSEEKDPLKILLVLKKYHADLKVMTDHGEGLLHWAVLNKQESALEFLILQGLNVNAEDFQKNTPLHCAVLQAEIPLICILLKFGANVMLLNKEHSTPLVALFKEWCLKNSHVSELDLRSNINIFKSIIECGIILSITDYIELKRKAQNDPRLLSAIDLFWTECQVMIDEQFQLLQLHKWENEPYKLSMFWRQPSHENSSSIPTLQNDKLPEFDYHTTKNILVDRLEKAKENDSIFQQLARKMKPFAEQKTYIDTKQKIILQQIEFINSYRGKELPSQSVLEADYLKYFETVLDGMAEDEINYLTERKSLEDKTWETIREDFQLKYEKLSKCPILPNQSLDEIIRKLERQYAVLGEKSVNIQEASTPISMAYTDREAEAVQHKLHKLKILEQEFKKHHSEFKLACKEGNLIAVDNFLSTPAIQGVLSRFVNEMDASNECPLHVACQYGHLEIVMMLLKAKADPNYLDGNGYSPIHYAIQPAINKDCFVLLETLTQWGADITLRAVAGRTPLHTAAFHGNLIAVQWLCNQENININACETDEADCSTALHKAVSQRHIAVVDYLLACNANPRIPNRLGETPLVSALIELNSYIPPENANEFRSHYQAIVNTFIDRGVGLSNSDINYLFNFTLNKPELLSAIRNSFNEILKTRKNQCEADINELHSQLYIERNTKTL